ncbi:Biotin-protein ligase [Methanobacterium lacus]|uniref:Biotin-protein ligase n=2 Tax=Methanobacterium lacus (strain AL-21) TaxID=877455 RepID=F0TA56_METLA|nr:Biotin-protein ligase [Methanobacterium lacus]
MSKYDSLFHLGVVKIKQKLALTILLLIGLSMTLNLGTSFAANSSSTSNVQIKNTTNTTVKTTATSTKTVSTAKTVGTTSTKTVRVLIYNGNGAITSCVTGIKTALTSVNNNNLVPGYKFTYATSTTISSSILSNYDLLVMPGGSSGRTYINSLSSSAKSAIKNFVYTGHGFLGICAGAYAGSNYVDSMYSGLGVAPHVRSKSVIHEGTLPVTMTSSGSSLLGFSGTLNLAHYNGPAMYASGGTITTFATYADSSTGYKGYGAIVGDTYGSGRTVLSGPHPELAPQNPTLLAKMMIWASNVGSSTSTSFTMSQINTAAKSVKTYIETNKKMPSYVTISGTQVTMAQFLKLLTSDLINVNSGSSSAITLTSTTAPGSTVNTLKAGNIQKSEYLKIANSINSFINTNNRAPSYASSTLGKIGFGSMVYMFSKIMVYYASNGRLPSYVSMTSSSYL